MTTKTKLKKGDKVTWKWGQGSAHGTIKTVYEHEITKELKGSEITRHGTNDCPALLIEQEDGDEVLKLASEVTVCS